MLLKRQFSTILTMIASPEITTLYIENSGSVVLTQHAYRHGQQAPSDNSIGRLV